MPAEAAPETIGGWIAHWADATPDAPVLFDPGREPLTYRRLARLCDDVHAALNGWGIGRNDRVAIVHPGGADCAAALLATWGCAAAAPLNPDQTADEFIVTLKDVKADVLVVPENGAAAARIAAAGLGLPVFELVHAGSRIAGAVALSGGMAAPARLPGPAQADDLALVLTTSGTTSQAKVVPRSQRKLLTRLHRVRADHGLTADDRALVVMPLYHLAGAVTSLASAMVTGGSVVVPTGFDVAQFVDVLEQYGATWTHASPVILREIATRAAQHREAIGRSRLRLIHCGAGYLDAELAGQVSAALGVPILLAYGMTEAPSIAVQVLQPRRKRPGGIAGTVGVTTPARLESVGRPAYGDGNVAIMTADGAIAGAGVEGEVVVRGEYVFDGYDDNAEANAIAFVDGWFRTGDQGRIDPDGYLHLTGRIKEMINRGGEKVAPSEVDAVLAEHQDVAEAATFPIPHPTLGEEVAAAVVLRDLAIADGLALRRFAQVRLAGYKVPRRFVFVDAIPKGPTGKVQRNKLAAAFGLNILQQVPPAGAGNPGRAPTPLEARLQAIWARTLGQPQVGLDDDYFLLGGDSLQAVELFLAIEQELGHHLSSAMLFEAGTVAEMAAWIERDRHTGNLVPLQPRGTRPPLFCAPGVDGNVFVYRVLAGLLDPDQPTWGLRLDGVDETGVPFRRIDDMAAHFVAAVRRMQPHGPYCLAGYSFGGQLVYEMAQQLRRAGHDVALLALFDTYPEAREHRLRLRDRIGFNLQRMRSLSGRRVAGYVAAKIAQQSDKAATRLRRRVYGLARRWYAARRRPLPRYLFDAEELNLALGAAARLRPYAGSAVLFKAERFAWADPNAHDRWADLVLGGLEVRPTPGGHYDMLHVPHVQPLAASLQDSLDRALAADAVARRAEPVVNS